MFSFLERRSNMTTEEKQKMVLTISQWRSLKEMNKRQLSEKSGVTEKTIYNYEMSQKNKYSVGKP